MGKIVINNLSSAPDTCAAMIAYRILNYDSEETICRIADDNRVDVDVCTDDTTGEKTFTITDRD